MQVRFRQLDVEDLPQLRDWRNDDRLRATTREYRLLNMVNQDDWFEHISRSREVEMFGIEFLTNTGFELVGVCGLCNITWVNRTAEISIYVESGWSGSVVEQALGLLRQKAFEEFNLHRLWAEIYEFNKANIVLFEKCGYVLEGRLREHVFKQDKYHDSLMYGLVSR